MERAAPREKQDGESAEPREKKGERKESKGGRSKVREGEKKDENRGCKIHAGCTKRN